MQAREPRMSRMSRFDTTVLPHLDAAYNLARWLTRNDQDAQDVVQESFMRALKYFEAMKGEEAKPWLLAIVRNTCFTWLEKNRPAEVVPLDDSDGASATPPAAVNTATPEVILLQSANRKLVNQA